MSALSAPDVAEAAVPTTLLTAAARLEDHDMRRGDTTCQ